MEEKNKKAIPKSDNNKIFTSSIIASSTECTGLIPTLPLSVDEAKSYTEIYGVPQPKVKTDNGQQHK